MLKLSEKEKQLRGFNLLELLLVLLIIAGVMLAAISRYQAYRNEQQVKAIETNVAVIMQAFFDNYRANCNGTVDPPYKLPPLYRVGNNGGLILPTQLIRTPLVKDYGIYTNCFAQVGTGAKPYCVLYVTATLDINPNKSELYKNMLHADYVEPAAPDRMTWLLLPSQAPKQMSSKMWIAESGGRYFKRMVESQNSAVVPNNTSCAY